MENNKIPERNPDFFIRIATDIWANMWVEDRKELGHDLIAKVELKDGEEVVYVERYDNKRPLKEEPLQRFENIKISLLEAIAIYYAKKEIKNLDMELEKMKSFLKNY